MASKDQNADTAPQTHGQSINSPLQTPLFHAIHQARYTRQDQIRRIQDHTQRRLIALIGGPGTSISSWDIPPVVDLLDDVDENSDLDLMLQTPGGDIDQAERITLLCRKKIKKGKLRVVVPDSAKSAGTIIAISADQVVMGFVSELGPIDPQITVTTAGGDPMRRPAQSFLDGLEEIIQQTGSKPLSPAYFPLLDKLDPALIDFCKKAGKRSENLATALLKKYMLAGSPQKARAVARDLNNVKKYLSHGAVIDAERAEKLGLDIEYLPPKDPLWQAYWRLYCEMRIAIKNDETLYEGEKASLIV